MVHVDKFVVNLTTVLHTTNGCWSADFWCRTNNTLWNWLHNQKLRQVLDQTSVRSHILWRLVLYIISFGRSQPKTTNTTWSARTGERTGSGSALTGNLHDVSRDDVSGTDPLNTLLVLTVNFPHLRLVLLQSLDGVLCVTLLHTNTHCELLGFLLQNHQEGQMTCYWYIINIWLITD